MNKIYTVIVTEQSYEETTTYILGAFTSKEKAQELVDSGKELRKIQNKLEMEFRKTINAQNLYILTPEQKRKVLDPIYKEFRSKYQTTEKCDLIIKFLDKANLYWNTWYKSPYSEYGDGSYLGFNSKWCDTYMVETELYE